MVELQKYKNYMYSKFTPDFIALLILLTKDTKILGRSNTKSELCKLLEKMFKRVDRFKSHTGV